MPAACLDAHMAELASDEEEDDDDEEVVPAAAAVRAGPLWLRRRTHR
jgi:hypothetical protein